MGIYWKRTSEVYPDASWSEDSFIALDPDVRFPRFDMETGDEPIGSVQLIKGGPGDGHWCWSMTVSLPGPAYVHPISGREADKVEAGRKVIACYRHYLSTRPEQYPR